jgi:TolB-like protein/DNA-binding SARP family transcriptional activator
MSFMAREGRRQRVSRPQHSGRERVVRPQRRPVAASATEPRSSRPFQLGLLGSFVLRHNAGSSRRLPKKAQALLGYLAMQRGRAVPREQLAELLWSNSGGEQARRSLRQCLMSVRAALKAAGNNALLAEGDSVALMPDHAVDIDVAAFEALSASQGLQELEAASALYRDEFLNGLQVTSEPFAEWVLVERRRIASAMSDVLYRLAAARAEAGQLDKAVAAAERLTAFDPLREDAHRLLMTLQARAGRRSAALNQFERCADILRRDLGVTPEAATSELAATIRRGTAIGKPAPVAPTAPPANLLPALPLPDKPSIAVLAFKNLSTETNDDYLIDGMVEDITIALGRVPWLFVIASSSAFTYRGRDVDIRQVGDELGVRYLLRGSVRRSASRIRIVVQLNDTTRGSHIWADRFDGKADDIFELQDRVANQTAATIAPAVHAVEIERAQRKPTESLTAYDLYLRALHCYRSSFDSNRQALGLLYKAIEIDPSFGAAYGLASRCYHLQAIFGWIPPDHESMNESFRLARVAAEIGKDDSEALWMAGHNLARNAGELDYGLSLIERSLALNPNSATAWVSSSFVHAYLGHPERALEDFARAQRLNPRDAMHHVQWHVASLANFVAGRYEESAKADEKALQERPAYAPSLRMRVVTCGLLGRLDEAKHYLDRLLAGEPDASVARFKRLNEKMFQRNPDALARFLEGARRAGLPEE